MVVVRGGVGIGLHRRLEEFARLFIVFSANHVRLSADLGKRKKSGERGVIPLVLQESELNQGVVLLRIDGQHVLEHLLRQRNLLRFQIGLRQALSMVHDTIVSNGG